MRISADAALIEPLVAFRMMYSDELNPSSPGDPKWDAVLAAGTIIDTAVETAFGIHGLQSRYRQLTYIAEGEEQEEHFLHWHGMYVPPETASPKIDRVRKSLGIALNVAEASIERLGHSDAFNSRDLPPARETLFVVPPRERGIWIAGPLFDELRAHSRIELLQG